MVEDWKKSLLKLGVTLKDQLEDRDWGQEYLFNQVLGRLQKTADDSYNARMEALYRALSTPLTIRDCEAVEHYIRTEVDPWGDRASDDEMATANMMGGVFGPPPSPGDIPVPTTLDGVDEWINATLRLPKGALARLYRLLHDAEGLRIDGARDLETQWRKTLG